MAGSWLFRPLPLRERGRTSQLDPSDKAIGRAQPPSPQPSPAVRTGEKGNSRSGTWVTVSGLIGLPCAILKRDCSAEATFPLWLASSAPARQEEASRAGRSSRRSVIAKAAPDLLPDVNEAHTRRTCFGQNPRLSRPPRQWAGSMKKRMRRELLVQEHGSLPKRRCRCRLPERGSLADWRRSR